MKSNKGITILVIILVIVCIFQGCSIASIKTSMEELKNNLARSERELFELRSELKELSEEIYDKAAMDVSYEVSQINWEKGTMQVQFVVEPEDVSSNTRILVQVADKKYELSREYGTFHGMIEYPLDEKESETIVYMYAGDVEKDSYEVDELSTGAMLFNKVGCKYDGYISYGNGRLTLAGDLYYGCDLDEEITSVHLVEWGTKTKLDSNLENKTEINLSKEIDNFYNDNIVEIQEIGIEFVLESQAVICVYPELWGSVCYQVDRDDMEYTEGQELYQYAWIVITLPDGTVYECSMHE